MRCSVAALAAIAGSAAAQTAEPSVAAYLCTFAGKCGDAEEAVVTREAPATKGFRIARARPQTEISATTSAGAVRSAPRAMAAARTPRSIAARPASYAPTARITPAAGAARPRADLMISFDLGSDRMTPAGTAKARVFAKSLLLPELTAKRFLIEGHTDSLGSAESNRELSRRRADAVADFLVVQGVGRDRLEVRGLGSDAPLSGHRASDPINRRVEAELIS
ncbi:OmpA family protein [Sphingomonas sp.]|uniref:OmpA family protein n=1 Tax=Sphingomonas sp. TaxID=28214 RepID=UPI0035C7989A